MLPRLELGVRTPGFYFWLGYKSAVRPWPSHSCCHWSDGDDTLPTSLAEFLLVRSWEIQKAGAAQGQGNSPLCATESLKISFSVFIFPLAEYGSSCQASTNAQVRRPLSGPARERLEVCRSFLGVLLSDKLCNPWLHMEGRAGRGSWIGSGRLRSLSPDDAAVTRPETEDLIPQRRPLRRL